MARDPGPVLNVFLVNDYIDFIVFVGCRRLLFPENTAILAMAENAAKQMGCSNILRILPNVVRPLSNDCFSTPRYSLGHARNRCFPNYLETPLQMVL